MSYKWEEFNIKTFPAETLVYRDGVFCPDLSTLDAGPIDNNYDLPIHIIYVGKIAGENRLDININVQNQPVFLSVRIENDFPAFLNIFVKNAGKNSELRGHVMVKNDSDLDLNITAHHTAPDTGILIKTKLIAGKNSKSILSGVAKIDKKAGKCRSDIGFSALAEKSAKITFRPAQFISAVPASAEHGAAIYHPTAPQIEYLRRAGLSGVEVADTLREAFMNDFPLF